MRSAHRGCPTLVAQQAGDQFGTPGLEAAHRVRRLDRLDVDDLVALDHAGATAPFQEEMQVGAADPAMAHLEQQLAGTRLRGRPVLDRHVPQSHEHRRRHGLGHLRHD